jgi:hypothetical protein
MTFYKLLIISELNNVSLAGARNMRANDAVGSWQTLNPKNPGSDKLR